MAQYDLLLLQNIASSGTDFAEKLLTLNKGVLITANASREPVLLPVGTDGQALVADAAEASGLKFATISTHTQNTDTGTTQTSFQIDSGNSGGRLKHLGTGKLGARNAGDSGYVDFQAARGTFTQVTLPSDPVADTDAANRAWVLAQITAQAALQFKGTIGSGATDTISITDFNALQTYSIGWLYVVNEDGTIRGQSATVGDWFIATEERSGSGSLDSDWTHIQFDTSDFVNGPAGGINTETVTIWDSNNRKIKDSGVLFSDMAQLSDLDDYIPKGIIEQHGMIRGKLDEVPENFVVAEQEIVGRRTGDTVRGLTASEVRSIINVEDGANNYTHPAGTVISGALTGANVFSQILVNSLGHVTGVSTRALSYSDVGARKNWVSKPANVNSAGTVGDEAYDENTGHYYLCIETGAAGLAKWVRFTGASW